MSDKNKNNQLVNKGRPVENEYPLNLVSTWKEFHRKSGRTLASQLLKMNKELGTSYTYSQLTQFEKVNKTAPRIYVVNYMIRDVMPHILMAYGISEKDAVELVEKFTISHE